MKLRAVLFLLILLGLFPLYGEELDNEEFENRENPMRFEYEPKFVPPPDTKGNKRISTYKEKMIYGIPNKDDLYDLTEHYYNDPEKADLFLEAHFNKYDNPDVDPAIRISISKELYDKNKDLYKKIRDKKLILTSTTIIFTKYSDIKEYPTGGFLSKHDYNYNKEEFDKIFNEKEIISKYSWRIKGKTHYNSMIFMEGRIKISVPKKYARNLTGDFFLYKVKRATIMGIFRIKEKTNSSITIEPIRYMIIWRKKKKVFTNFKASLDPAEMKKVSIENIKTDEDDFGDALDDNFDEDSGDDFGDEKDKIKSDKKTRPATKKKPNNKSNDDFVDEFDDFNEEEE